MTSEETTSIVTITSENRDERQYPESHHFKARAVRPKDQYNRYSTVKTLTLTDAEVPNAQFTVEGNRNRIYFDEGLRVTDAYASITLKASATSGTNTQFGTAHDETLRLPLHLNQITAIGVDAAADTVVLTLANDHGLNPGNSTGSTFVSQYNQFNLQDVRLVGCMVPISLEGNLATTQGALYTFTAITQANPVVVTLTTGHGILNADRVRFINVGGMTELNDVTFATTLAGDALTLTGIDGTGYGAYTSGGYAQATNKLILIDNATNVRYDQMYRDGNINATSMGYVYAGRIASPKALARTLHQALQHVDSRQRDASVQEFQMSVGYNPMTGYIELNTGLEYRLQVTGAGASLLKSGGYFGIFDATQRTHSIGPFANVCYASITPANYTFKPQSQDVTDLNDTATTINHLNFIGRKIVVNGGRLFVQIRQQVTTTAAVVRSANSQTILRPLMPSGLFTVAELASTFQAALNGAARAAGLDNATSVGARTLFTVSVEQSRFKGAQSDLNAPGESWSRLHFACTVPFRFMSEDLHDAHKYVGGNITAIGTGATATTRFTSNGHGLAVGDLVTVSGTRHHNGQWEVIVVATNTFDINHFNRIEETGTTNFARWSQPPTLFAGRDGILNHYYKNVDTNTNPAPVFDIVRYFESQESAENFQTLHVSMVVRSTALPSHAINSDNVRGGMKFRPPAGENALVVEHKDSHHGHILPPKLVVVQAKDFDTDNLSEFVTQQPHGLIGGDIVRVRDNHVNNYTLPVTATTTLNGAVDIADLTITLTSATNFATASGTDMQKVVINDVEVVGYTGITGNNLTGCVRGLDGTADVAHLTLVTVTQHLDPNVNYHVQGVQTTDATMVESVDLVNTFELARSDVYAATAPTSITLINIGRATEIVFEKVNVYTVASSADAFSFYAPEVMGLTTTTTAALKDVPYMPGYEVGDVFDVIKPPTAGGSADTHRVVDGTRVTLAVTASTISAVTLPTPVEITALSVALNTTTATATATAHGLIVGDVVIVEGAEAEVHFTITNITAAAPAVVTTAAAHNLYDGDVVTIHSATGSDVDGGTYQITVASTTTFQLQNSVNVDVTGIGTATTGTVFGRTGGVFDGQFKVVTVADANTFTYVVAETAPNFGVSTTAPGSYITATKWYHQEEIADGAWPVVVPVVTVDYGSVPPFTAAYGGMAEPLQTDEIPFNLYPLRSEVAWDGSKLNGINFGQYNENVGYDRSIRPELLGLGHHAYLWGVDVGADRQPPFRQGGEVTFGGNVVKTLNVNFIDDAIVTTTTQKSYEARFPPYGGYSKPDFDWPHYLLVCLENDTTREGSLVDYYEPGKRLWRGSFAVSHTQQCLGKVQRESEGSDWLVRHAQRSHAQRSQFGDSAVEVKILNPDHTYYQTHGQNWSFTLSILRTHA
tara:strand:+ start:3792 stop:8009 length:4218 start_codon:yes stop_codon:yes gene_type:complete